MKISAVKIGMKVSMESPNAAMRNSRERCVGVVKQKYRDRYGLTIFEVHAINLEPRQMAGWHTAASLKEWKRGAL